MASDSFQNMVCCTPGSHAQGLEVGEPTETTWQLPRGRKLLGRSGAAAEAVVLQRESRQLCETGYHCGDLSVSCTPACEQCIESRSILDDADAEGCECEYQDQF